MSAPILREQHLESPDESLIAYMQHTLKSPITFQGVGLHSGQTVTMVVHPAAADHGIAFVRTDVTSGDNVIPALWNNVVDTRLCTMIGNKAKVTVGTIEHLMAALRGCGVDNVRIELNAPEVPLMDGSAAPFVARTPTKSTDINIPAANDQ